MIAAVVEPTRAGDAWYAHYRQVLGWYLARWCVPENRAQTAVRKATGGRFESWVEPGEDLVGDVVDGLKLKLGRVHDHPADWLAVRESVAWPDFPVDDAPLDPLRDGAVHDIETVDRPRDPARADRLHRDADRRDPCAVTALNCPPAATAPG